MSSLIEALVILGIVVLSMGIILGLYILFLTRRRSIMYKKLDYLIEDLTYKSELINAPVETISKLANYVDIFEVVTKKNSKALAKMISRNKEDIYKIMDRFKKLMIGPDAKKSDVNDTKKIKIDSIHLANIDKPKKKKTNTKKVGKK